MTKTDEKEFTFDAIEELTDSLHEESEQLQNAAITFINNHITLTTVEFKDCEIVVYHVKEDEAIYAEMDKAYLSTIDNGESSGSDFWDRWAAVISTLNRFKIVDEVLNP